MTRNQFWWIDSEQNFRGQNSFRFSIGLTKKDISRYIIRIKRKNALNWKKQRYCHQAYLHFWSILEKKETTNAFQIMFKTACKYPSVNWASKVKSSLINEPCFIRVFHAQKKSRKSWAPQADSESTRKTKNIDTYIIFNGLNLSVHGFIKVY